MPRVLLDELLGLTGLGVTGGSVQVDPAPAILSTPLKAAETAAAVLGAQAALVNEIWLQRSGRRQTAQLDLQGAALALQSVHNQRQWQYRIAAAEPDYPTVALYRTQDDKFVMLNGGYPKLRTGLLELLNCPDNATAIGCAVKGWKAAALEEAAADRGLCAVVARDRQAWRAHPQGAALAAERVVQITRFGDAPCTPLPKPPDRSPPNALRPLSGVKVLDLTHVIAGPTCGKSLAEQGATVLHVYSPARPQLPPFDMDTGHGKLSTFLDLNAPNDKAVLANLVKDADVFAQSYRPGKIAGFGFSPEALSAMRPGIIVVSFNCYGFTGPWCARPGFEQLAQAASGIACVQGSVTEPKLALTFYPNDYITGFLAAFGTLAALLLRARNGGSYHVRVSLCRTAMMLLDQGFHDTYPSEADATALTQAALPPYMRERDTAIGRLHSLGPVVRYSETPSRWELPPVPLGAHPPRWPDPA